MYTSRNKLFLSICLFFIPILYVKKHGSFLYACTNAVYQNMVLFQSFPHFSSLWLFIYCTWSDFRGSGADDWIECMRAPQQHLSRIITVIVKGPHTKHKLTGLSECDRQPGKAGHFQACGNLSIYDLTQPHYWIKDNNNFSQPHYLMRFIWPVYSVFICVERRALRIMMYELYEGKKLQRTTLPSTFSGALGFSYLFLSIHPIIINFNLKQTCI